MSECEYIEGCVFFNETLKQKPSIAVMFEKNYCRGKFAECARFMVRTRVGPEAVPPDLFPNMTAKALELIAAQA